jgi:hypothetical protein
MKRRRLAWLIVAGLAMASACQPKFEKPNPDDLKQARQAAINFDVKLKREIMDRLARDEDPVAVYLAYADHVLDWSKEVSDTNKFDFSRTSLAPRNPASSPDDWEKRQLDEFNYMADTGLDPATFESSEIVMQGDTKIFRWMRPIAMTEECLACHGDKLDPRIKLLLAQEYPSDEATGYFEGQIGGAYSIQKVISVKGKPPPPYVPQPAAPKLPADARLPSDAPLVPVPQEGAPTLSSPNDPPEEPLQ